MIEQQCEYTWFHWTVHLKIVKIITFMLYIIYHIKYEN